MWLIVLAAIMLQVTISSGVYYRRQQRDCRADLKPLVEAAGFTWISCRDPGAGQVGPFPAWGFKVVSRRSRVGHIRGEYTLYRIVTVADAMGRQHEVWAKLEFELFQFHHAEWQPDLADLRNTTLSQLD